MDELTYFINFEYSNKLLESIFKDQKEFIYRVIFNDHKSSSGIIYRNRWKDYRNKNYITLDLGDEFLEFYLKYKNSKEFKWLDLRIVWFLNYNKTIQYKVKWIRDSMYIFNILNLCSAYDYPDPIRNHITVACNNHAFGKIDDNYYCLKHMAN